MHDTRSHFLLKTQNGRAYVSGKTSDVVILDSRRFLDMLSYGHEHGTDRYLLYESNLSTEFYDLSSGLAGEVLQKVSNYGIRLAIVGSFETVASDRFHELISELNRGPQIRFEADETAAVSWLTGDRTRS